MSHPSILRVNTEGSWGMAVEAKPPADRAPDDRPAREAGRRLSGKRQVAGIALAAVVALALVGWLAARQIRSPAQVAADTAAPQASPITAPVVRRTLSTEVIVRGTVRYGAPQAVVLGTSKLKQGNSDVVTRAPVRRQRLVAGRVAMAVDGRPVFVFPGAVPMHRDLVPGDAGPDVLQLERALVGFGLSPGPVDGRYDGATEGAVSSFYLSRGWDPFGPTDAQLDQLHTAEAAAAAARDAHLQAVSAIDQARQAPTPADVAQARIDAVTAKDAVDTAQLAVQTAADKVRSATTVAAGAPAAKQTAESVAQRDQAVADADVAAKRTALNAALDAGQIARMKADETALDAPPSERETAAAAVREAGDAVAQARAELDASVAAAAAARAEGPTAVGKAAGDVVQAQRDLRAAREELHRARIGERTARTQAHLAVVRLDLLRRPAEVGAMQAIAGSTAQEEQRTRAEVARLAQEGGVQVPANEALFFATLPLRVDAVKAKRGSQVSGTAMTVTNSRLAIDSSLAASDAQLVRPGNPVRIEEQELGIRLRGRVSRVADTPGTNRVDPSRFSFQVTPATGPVSLVGASVKLTIAVKSTRGRVLAVPAGALSLGGDGQARLQVRRRGRTVLVTVAPGLAADGLVAVRPAGRVRLRAGDLVVVGSRDPGRRGSAQRGSGP
jgi:multidrug efflux pump subunit AcrA (membrane-fusion protein)